MTYEKRKKPELISELNKSREKISELTAKLNRYKNKEAEFSGEIQKLQSEIKILEAEIKNLNERIDSLENEKQNFEDKLELKEKKIDELFQDKENLLKEKSVILESKHDILGQIKEKELQIQHNNQIIEDLREKFKKSSSELLSKSMQIDKLVKKDKNLEVQEKETIREFEEKIKDLEEELERSYQGQKKEIEKVAERSTKIISNMEDIFELLKKILPQAKSNIRLVLPDIQDLSKYELIDIIKEMPNKVRLNIAAKINDPATNILISELKNYCKFTDYSEKKIIALNIDSSKCLIGIFSGAKVISIYSEILEIIEILNPSIMEPFIRGTRI
ncbi:MAG: coiled-coil domain-containing protein [Candidatus Hodarchaeota archaeon]